MRDFLQAAAIIAVCTACLYVAVTRRLIRLNSRGEVPLRFIGIGTMVAILFLHLLNVAVDFALSIAWPLPSS